MVFKEKHNKTYITLKSFNCVSLKCHFVRLDKSNFH
nr:MAG TPA: hypothetical protein [Caudoviricetes sp.]